jgi:hypothetical protein
MLLGSRGVCDRRTRPMIRQDIQEMLHRYIGGIARVLFVGLASWDFSAVPDGTIPALMSTQDCVLGYFQPSPRDWTRLESFPGTASVAVLSQPFGTRLGEGSSQAEDK